MSGIAPPRRGMRGGVVERVAGNLPFDALAVRHHVQLGTAAAGQAEARQRDRRAHELHEAAAGDFVAFQLGRALREFALELRAEFGRVGEFLEAAPVALARASGLGDD